MIRQLIFKKSFKVSAVIILSVLVAIVILSLLHFSYIGNFGLRYAMYLPVQHWVVFSILTLLSAAVLYVLFFRIAAARQFFINRIIDNLKKFYAPKSFPENLLITFLLGIIIFLFVYTLRNITLANYDDVAAFFSFRSVSSWSTLMSDIIPSLPGRGRLSLSGLFLATAAWWVYNSESMIIYTLYFYLPIIFNIFVFAYIVSKRTNKYLGLLMVALYFSMAQVNWRFNLFVSYPLNFHFYFLAFLLSAEFFLRHIERESKYNLHISAFFMFVSFVGYESFLTYFALFPIYILCRNFDSKSLKRTLTMFFRSLPLLKFHALAVFLYLVSYFVQTLVFAPVNVLAAGGHITIDAGSLSIQGIANVIYNYATDLFPLRDFIGQSFIHMFHFSHVSIEVVIMALCTTVLCCFILTKNIDISGRKVVGICFMSLVAAFVFPIPHSLTKHHIGLVESGLTGFVPSFFGYYWLLLVIVVLVFYFFRLLRFNKLLLIIIAPLIFMTTIFTGYANAGFIIAHEGNVARYRAFGNLVSSEYFASIEEGAYIYVHGYLGFPWVLGQITQYAESHTGRMVNFVFDSEYLEDAENSYFLMYDTSNRFIMIGRIEDGLTGNELFIMPTETIGNGGFIGIKSPGVSPVTIDGVLMGKYDYSINIPMPYIGMDGILVEADGLQFEQVSITNSRISSNDYFIVQRPLTLDTVIDVETRFHGGLVSGWSVIYDWGVWSIGYTAELNFSILADEIADTSDLELIFNLRAVPSPTYLAVYINDYFAAEYVLSGWDIVTVPLPYDILAKANSIEDLYDINVRFEIANPVSPYELGISTDTRILGIGLERFSVSAVDGNLHN